MTTNYIGKKREEYIKLLTSRLKPSRLEHTLRVEEKAIHLSLLYGEDPAKAQTAALLHDLMKNADKEETDALVSKYLIIKEEGGDNLLHGILASYYIEDDLDIHDEDIINSVRNHTAGRKGMSRLEKIIYLADLIEDGRNYPGVKELRALSEKNLDDAVYASAAHLINYLVSTGCPILGGTIELYNEYAIKNGERKRK